MLQNCLTCSNQSPYQCVDCPSNLGCCQYECATCINQTTCINCWPGYQLDSQSGICQLSNSCDQFACASCSNTQQCSLCLTGYVLNYVTNQCYICPYNCQQCTLDGFCLWCQPGFYINQLGQCASCNTILSNCQFCINQLSCIVCYKGFVYSPKVGNCIGCGYQCYQCTLQQQKPYCLACNSHTYLSQNACEACHQSCNQCNGSAKSCAQCNSLSFYYQGTCISCNTAIPLCLSCSINDLQQVTCLACQYLTCVWNNSCHVCPANCMTCSSPTTCLQCAHGYYLVNQTCQQCQYSNCLVCNSQGCNTCSYGYGLNSSSLCVPCSENCLSCDPVHESNPCLVCYLWFILVEQACQPCGFNCQNCIASGCLYCTNGFFPDFQNNCIPCAPNCLICKGIQDCKSCDVGTYLEQGRCILCEVSNCYFCQSDAQMCQICKPGYFLTNNNTLCLPCQDNCSTCDSNSSCSYCMQGHYFNNNTNSCSACQSGCLVCDNTICLQCLAGYYLINNFTQCSKCPTACDQCLSSLYCTLCHDGFFLSYFQSIYTQSVLNQIVTYQLCQACISPCKSCTSISQCTECQTRFALTKQGVCEPCPAGCLSCLFGLACQICDQGYALTYVNGSRVTECTPCPLNCTHCKSSIGINTQIVIAQCIACPEGWTMLNNASCFLCGSTYSTQGCQVCNQYATCSTCYPGYSLQSNGTCINTNQKTVSSDDLPFIASSIGLGVLSMILLSNSLLRVVILIALKQKSKVSLSDSALNRSQISQS